MAERDWERRVDMPTLDEASLRMAIEAHVDTRVERIAPMAGGKVNAHVRAHLASGDSVVLRIYLRDVMAAPKERALLEKFNGALPVPAVRGHGTCELEGLPHPYLLLTWVPGETLDGLIEELGASANESAGRAVGAAMAAVHAETRSELGFLDAALTVREPMGPFREVWTGYTQQLMEREIVAARLGPARRDALLALQREEAALLDATEGTFSIQHGDCKPTNVRVLPDGTLTGLMDWEFAWSGPRLFDWGQMLRWPVPAAYEAGLVAGYEQAGGGRPLEGDGRRAAQLIDLMNLLSFLGDGSLNERERAVADALALIDQTLEPA